MRSVTKTFQISIYGVLLLSSLMLAYAEGSVIPQGISVPLIVLAFFFTDRFQVLQIPLWGANALGLAAFLLALMELMGNSIEARLLSGAHLLVYLSWVVVFQKKTARHYWWICALSVLEVAVGSVLTTAPPYGALLLVYSASMIWTLSLFSLWQTQEQFRDAGAGDEAGDVAAPQGDATPSDAAARSLAGAAAPGRHDGAGVPVLVAGPFAVLRQSSHARGTLHVDPDERWLGMRFALGSAMTTLCSLVMASLFFVFIPRFWIGSMSFGNEPISPGVRSLTGFTEKVRLGDIGRIMESTEPVLQLNLIDNETGEELDVEEYARAMGMEEPLFRGAVLSTYYRGDWTSGRSLEDAFPGRIGAYPRDELRVRQEITMQPIGTNFLLAMHPALEARMAGRTENSVGQHRMRNVLVHMDKARPREPFSYLVFSPVPGEPLRRDPFRVPSERLEAVRRHYGDLPPLDGLRKEALRVAGIEPGQPRPRDAEIADRFVHWLRDSGEFGYSLDSSIQDPSLDPVEDFLLIRKEGHCEYYAAALALLLRSVDIPSRMVSGFKGGEINTITGAFEVEQRHAHAWVEALIDGRWKTLDATPAAARSESLAALKPTLPTFHDLLNFAREIWSVYVVNMTIGQQRDRVYAPFQELLAGASDLFAGRSVTAAGLMNRLKRMFASPREWISIEGGIVTFVLLAAVAALAWGVRRLWNFIRRARLARGPLDAALRRRIEFYERFRKLCAQSGMSRGAAETQREFGRTVEERWKPLLNEAGLTSIPDDLTESFYHVRFGNGDLDPEAAAALDRSLGRLEAAVSAAR